MLPRNCLHWLAQPAAEGWLGRLKTSGDFPFSLSSEFHARLGGERRRRATMSVTG